jgi:hypothetical protein
LPTPSLTEPRRVPGKLHRAPVIECHRSVWISVPPATFEIDRRSAEFVGQKKEWGAISGAPFFSRESLDSTLKLLYFLPLLSHVPLCALPFLEVRAAFNAFDRRATAADLNVN